MPSKVAQLLTAIAEALAANGATLGIAAVTRPQVAEAPLLVEYGDGEIIEISALHMIAEGNPTLDTGGNAS